MLSDPHPQRDPASTQPRRSEPKPKRSGNAERQAAYRSRSKRGVRMLMIEGGDDFAEALIVGGWLTESEAEDPAKLAREATAIVREFTHRILSER